MEIKIAAPESLAVEPTPEGTKDVSSIIKIVQPGANLKAVWKIAKDQKWTRGRKCVYP
jgi:hypothetical protein